MGSVEEPATDEGKNRSDFSNSNNHSRQSREKDTEMKAKLFQNPELVRQLQAVRSQLIVRANQRKLETVASELGAELADPEQYRVCEELARKPR